MTTPYIALGTLLFSGSILTLILVLSLLRRRRAAQWAQAAADHPTERKSTALPYQENDVPSVLPFMAIELLDDTQPFAPGSGRQSDFIPIVEIDDEEPTHPAPPPRRVITHDPDLPSITIQPDAKAAHPQRADIARLIAYFEAEKVETNS